MKQVSHGTAVPCCRRPAARLIATVVAVAVSAATALTLMSNAPAVASESGEQQAEGELVIVLDASGSMTEPAGDGRTRWQAAQRAMNQVIDELPGPVNAGLRVYGSKISDGPGSCEDSELVVPVDTGNRQDLRQAVRRAEPLGNTPIAYSLREAAGDLSDDGPRSIVLVSDGEESCGGDPCAAAEDVADAGVDLHVDVIGFQVDGAARDQLTCIAQAGKGTFYDAPDADALASQLSRLSARAARGYEAHGAQVEGTPQPEGAPEISAGLWLDTIGDDADTKHYQVAPTDDATLHLAATVRPTSANMFADTHVSVRVTGPQGRCAADSYTSIGHIDRLTPVSVSLRVSAEDLEECGSPQTVRVTRDTDRNPGAQPLEVVVMEEPAVEDPDALPPGAEDGYDAQAQVGGRPQQIAGAPSLSGAPTLEPGRYRDTILVTETLFYAAELDWGQQLVCDIDYGAAAELDEAISLLEPSASVAVYGPTRAELSGSTMEDVNSASYDGTADVSVHTVTPPVRYHNRDTSEAAGASLPGTYYCAVKVNGQPDLAEAGEIPVTLALDVVGSAGEGAPTYVDDAEADEDSAEDGSEAPEDTSTADEPDEAGAGFDAAGWLFIGLVAALLLGGVAFALRMMRRLRP